MRPKSVECSFCTLTPSSGAPAGRFVDWCPVDAPSCGYVGSVLRCSRCGLGRLVPEPSSEQLSKAYDGYGVHVTPASSRSREDLLSLSRLLPGPSRPKWLLGGVLRATELIAGRSIPLKYKEPLRMSRSAAVLDFGLGSGHYLGLLRAIGFNNLSGFDIIENPFVRQQLPDADLRFDSCVEQAAFKPASFDLITLVHVLEHVSDPVRVLGFLRTLLRQNGVIVVEVPDFGGWVSLRARAQFAHLDPPRHLWHFSEGALRNVCARAGLRVEHTEHSFSPDAAIASLRRLKWLAHFGVSRSLLTRFGMIRALLGSGTELSLVAR